MTWCHFNLMRTWLKSVLLISLFSLTCSAQQPPVRLSSPPARTEKPQTKNFQIELQMKRGDKTARYVVAFNGGQVTTDLIDKLSETNSVGVPRKISFSLSFNEFEDGDGGEVSIHLGRSLPYKTKVQAGAPGNSTPTERELIQEVSMGLTTKVALHSGKA